MQKAVPLVLTLVVVGFVVWAGFLKSPSKDQAPDMPGNTPKLADATPIKPNSTSEINVPRPSDPAVAAAMDEILAAWDKVQVVTAKVETLIPEAAGHKGRTDGKGDYYLQKNGAELLIHFYLFNELKIRKDEGTKLITGEVISTTIDGKYNYTWLNQPSHRVASKDKLNYDDVLHIGGPYLFRDLVSNNQLSLLPEEMKDNRATKVFKAIPKEGSWESIHHFDKATGIRVEMVELDADGKPRLTIKLPQIDTTTPINPEKFQFVVPEGFTFEDRTTTP